MRAKSYANVLQILILIYSSGPEKLPGLSRNGRLGTDHLLNPRLVTGHVLRKKTTRCDASNTDLSPFHRKSDIEI